MGAAVAFRNGWRMLGMPPKELRLENTLPTGQSFRWRKTADEPLEFTGVVGKRLVVLQQSSDDVSYRVVARGPGEVAAGDALALEDYFQKPIALSDLSDHWASRDQRFRQLQPYLGGARMLRQDPLECLFSFICSSNNHISRIHGMVERLASNYGEPIEVAEGADLVVEEGKQFYAFPNLEQLAEASEEALRADGYGYRAKFIVGAVRELQKHPEGGHAWLMGLRDAPLEEATAALQTLPGIGPKVAACVALFSLDKSDAIPVDTHVWQLALRYYCPHLKDRSLTPKVHGEVQAAFKDVFGPHCGWAHNTLFVGELPSIRDKLPDHLRPVPVEKPPKKVSKKALEGKDKADGAASTPSAKKTAAGPKKAGGAAAGKGSGPKKTPSGGKGAAADEKPPGRVRAAAAAARTTPSKRKGKITAEEDVKVAVTEAGATASRNGKNKRPLAKQMPNDGGRESASAMTHQQRIASWKRTKRSKIPDGPSS